MLNKSFITTGDDNADHTLRSLAYPFHINTDTFIHRKLLALHLFLRCEQCIDFSDIDGVSSVIVTLNHTGDDTVFRGLILILDDPFLLFPDFLNHHLLSLLGRDTTEVFRCHFDGYNISELAFRELLRRIRFGNLLRIIGHLSYHRLLHIDVEFTGLTVHIHTDILNTLFGIRAFSFAELSFTSHHQRTLDRLEKGFLVDFLFFRKLLDSLDEFTACILRCLFFLCHDFFPPLKINPQSYGRYILSVEHHFVIIKTDRYPIRFLVVILQDSDKLFGR